MKLIDFVFGVLKETTPMDPKEHANLYAEIENDISKVVIDKENKEFYKPTIKAKVLGFFQNPWVRLGMACSFIIVVKTLRDWLNGRYDKEEVEED